jgi:hypothetical protein
MSLSAVESLVKAGTLDILLDTPILNTPPRSPQENQSTTLQQQEWIPFDKNRWTPLDKDKRTVGWINQLQQTNKIQATCYSKPKDSVLRVRIYVILTKDSLVSDYYDWKDSHYAKSPFLELMLLLDRRPDLFLDNYTPAHCDYIRRPILSPFKENVSLCSYTLQDNNVC